MKKSTDEKPGTNRHNSDEMENLLNKRNNSVSFLPGGGDASHRSVGHEAIGEYSPQRIRDFRAQSWTLPRQDPFFYHPVHRYEMQYPYHNGSPDRYPYQADGFSVTEDSRQIPRHESDRRRRYSGGSDVNTYNMENNNFNDSTNQDIQIGRYDVVCGR
jgi:hypothetical protein